MKRVEGEKNLAKNNRKFFARTNLRLRLTSGILSSLGVVIAAILFSSDFSWINTKKPLKMRGYVIRDLDKNGIQNYGDLAMGNIQVESYSDVNANGKVDAYDIKLDQTYSNASGFFTLELPYLNEAVYLAENVVEKLSWSQHEICTLHFPRINIEPIHNIKEAWIVVESQNSFSEFASTNISLPTSTTKVIRWDHKPWKKGKKYKSANLKDLLKPLLESSKKDLDLELNLRFSEGSLAREIRPRISLHIRYENKGLPFLIQYESGFDSKGFMHQQVAELDKQVDGSIFLPYEGRPAHCLSSSVGGSFFQFSRFSNNGFSLSPKSSKNYTNSPTLLSDPVSGLWMMIKHGKMQILDADREVLREVQLQLPFCLEDESCISAFAYHPFEDEIWLIDKEYKLWKIGIIREQKEFKFSVPVLVADWKESGVGIPGRISRMVINPENEEIHFITQKENGETHLNKNSIKGDKFRPLGPLVYGGKVLKNINGFDYRPKGEIWVMHFDKEENTQEIFKIDPAFQLMSLISSVPAKEELTACACLATAPFQLTTKVFDDKNLNERIDEGERLLRNVRINALTYESPTIQPKQLKADAEGLYTFRTYRRGMTTFQIEKESLPEGILSINNSSLIIPHKNETLGTNVDHFNFPVTHVSNSPSIRWAGIRGKLVEGGVHLEWATAKEEDSRFFEVLRSEDGINYETVGGIESVGNSHEMQEYEYKDYLIDELETPIVAYRVKMKGGLGRINFSPVTQIVISKPSEGLNLKVHVHPSNESVRLNYQVLKPGPAELRILNLTGSVLTTIPLGISPNGAEKNIPVKGWSKGMYYAQLRNGENSVMVRWILK